MLAAASDALGAERVGAERENRTPNLTDAEQRSGAARAAWQRAAADLTSAFRVAVRCRPLLPKERAQQGESILTVHGKSVAVSDEQERGADSPRANRPGSATPRSGTTTPRGGMSPRASPRRERPVRAFTFDHVFGEESTQEQLYAEFVQPYTNKFIAGYNVTVFAYGQTGTGKTYTVLGADGASRGVVPRFVEAVMAHAQAEQRRAALEEQERRAAEQGGGADGGGELEGGLRPMLVETVLERVSLSVFEVYEGKVRRARLAHAPPPCGEPLRPSGPDGPDGPPRPSAPAMRASEPRPLSAGADGPRTRRGVRSST